MIKTIQKESFLEVPANEIDEHIQQAPKTRNSYQETYIETYLQGEEVKFLTTKRVLKEHDSTLLKVCLKCE